jgi:hypothetical protein
MSAMEISDGGPAARPRRSGDCLETPLPPEVAGVDLPDSPEKLYRIIRSLVKERYRETRFKGDLPVTVLTDID